MVGRNAVVHRKRGHRLLELPHSYPVVVWQLVSHGEPKPALPDLAALAFERRLLG